MEPMWTQFAPAWAPEGEGDGGGSGDGEGSGDGDQKAGDGSGDDDGDKKSGGLYEFADGAKSKDGADGSDGDKWAAPDDIPEHLRGADADKTLAKVFTAYKGARKSITKGEGEGDADVPEKADGYKIEPTGDDDAVAVEFNSEGAKPVVDAFKNAAHEIGIGAKTFEAFMRKGLGNMLEAGLPIGVTPEQDATAAGEAELEQLTKDVGAAEAGTVLNTNLTYFQKQVDKGIWSQAMMEEMQIAMGTSMAAKGFYDLLVSEFGEKPIPINFEGADGAVSSVEAYALSAKAHKMKDGAERDEALALAKSAMAKAFGTETRSGSMRSNVL